MTPVLSVLIPTRNRWGLAVNQVRAVLHVLGALGIGFEIVVHDNWSIGVDETERSRLPPEVRYVRSTEAYDTAEENICAGLRQCRGEYVWLLADDDGVEPNGVAELARLVVRGEDDILVFNSRHGRDDRLIGDTPPEPGESGRSFAIDDYVAGEGPHVSERARRLFFGPQMVLPIAAFAQKTGIGYWLCAMSTLVVRRAIADPAVLLKYLAIARIYAHGAWLVEIGRGRRFRFVNRPLVVYGLLPSDRDGGRTWRRGGIREGGYALSIWTGLWLKVLDELVAVGAMSEAQVCKTLDMNHAGRTHWGSRMLDKVLTQLGELPQPVPADEMAAIRRWVRRIFPGAVFLSLLLDEIDHLTGRLGQPLSLIEGDAAASPKDRALARDLRRRAAWWRDRNLATPWWTRMYVETVRFYDVYDLCDDWAAVHCAFTPAEQLLEVIDMPSAAPVFLRAPSRDALMELIEAQAFDVAGYEAIREMRFSLPDQWSRGATPSGGGARPSNFAALDGRREGQVWRAAHIVHPAFEALKASLLACPTEEGSHTKCDGGGCGPAALPGIPLRHGADAPRHLRRFAREEDHPAAAHLEPGRLLNVADEEAEPYLEEGFSYPHNGLRWTDNLLPTLRFGHERRAHPARLSLWPQEVWSRDGSRGMFDLLVDGEVRDTIELEPGRPLDIAFSPEEMGRDGVKAVALRPHDAKRPSDPPIHDHRRLGCALLALAVRLDAMTRIAPRYVVTGASGWVGQGVLHALRRRHGSGWVARVQAFGSKGARARSPGRDHGAPAGARHPDPRRRRRRLRPAPGLPWP